MSLMKYKLRKFGKLIGINFSLKDMNKSQTALFYLLLISGLLIPNASKAEVRLPAIVSSNMVLQRNTTITLWGWADGEEALEITASWLKKPINIAADHWDDATESNN